MHEPIPVVSGGDACVNAEVPATIAGTGGGGV